MSIIIILIYSYFSFFHFQFGWDVRTLMTFYVDLFTVCLPRLYTRGPRTDGPLVCLCLSSQVMSIRTVHEHLKRLLPMVDQQALRLSDAFSPFSGIQPLLHNPYTEPLWQAAVAQYERGMAPAEHKIAQLLRSQLVRLEAQPNQLLREFQKYKELVRRPGVSKELLSERCAALDVSSESTYMHACIHIM